jgi:hypothetical protein
MLRPRTSGSDSLNIVVRRSGRAVVKPIGVNLRHLIQW